MDNILVVMAHSSYSFGYGTSPTPSNIGDIGPMTLSTILLCDPNVGNSYMPESPRDVFNLLMYMLTQRYYDGVVPYEIMVEDNGFMNQSVEGLRDTFDAFVKNRDSTTPGEQRFRDCKGVVSDQSVNGGLYFNRPYEFFEGNRPFGCAFLIQKVDGRVGIYDVLSDFLRYKVTRKTKKRKTKKYLRLVPLTLTRTELFRHVREKYFVEDLVLVDTGCTNVNGELDACDRFDADKTILGGN